MSDKPIWYEPHPVSDDRKAEILAQGYRILDSVFKPSDYEQSEEKPEKTARKKRGE